MTSIFVNSPFFAFLGGSTEWLIIGGIALLLFGGAKLPKLARSIGQSVVEFKRGIKSSSSEDDDEESSDRLEAKGKPSERLGAGGEEQKRVHERESRP